MAKKKHAEEHVNLERYLVSYADFITLLFATFVVLYALAQVDISEYTKLEDSMRKAFAAPSLMQGSDNMLTGQDSILNSSSSFNDQAIIPPMLENTSQKYEEESFKEIKKAIDEMKKTDQLQGIDTSITDRGLVISLKDMNLFFKSASAELNPNSHKTLKELGHLIRSRFENHLIRVEGHTDDLPIKSSLYPSNWELSSARASSIIRFLIENFKFKKDKFAAIGYADIRELASNNTESGRQKNRRVEIVVLRNKYLKSEAEFKDVKNIKITNAEITSQQSETASNTPSVSDAAKKLTQEAGYSPDQVIILKDGYDNKISKTQSELAKFEQDKAKRHQNLQVNITHEPKTTQNLSAKPQTITYQKKKVENENNILNSLINDFGSAKKLLNQPHKK
jgi:chemotaxis protein MotB